MTIIEAFILGLIQGLTEFLPVSSSGHLVLGQHILGIDTSSGGNTFEVFVHFGTVLSIATVYWRDLLFLGASTWTAVRSPGRLKQSFQESEGFNITVLIGITMIPTGIVYLLFDDAIESAFSSPKFAAGMLLVTAAILFATFFSKNPSGKPTVGKALLIGLAQGAAMIPGISRSGSTIVTALFLNVSREQAARFSFLMSAPVIVAATLLEAIDLETNAESMPMASLLVGLLVAYVSGVFAIRAVVHVVKRNNLPYFGIYCAIAAILGLIFI